ncbi:Rho termination factor N-terminal domain-containing protein [Streptococcus anginosus]|uniref:Rho termination factor N-terminal domain-containing protein n=1 Tax=Streptococcus anginosus TaxID=1328 RepID=UPI000C7CE294|nr:Rho termination factor N-terminal domain-containing protein [Streptococcus anginosus]MCW0945128.1 Rho termination factor N-terminal domain-containing protein [Streptococcus anginosus]MCW1082761.1 Rho termination factor N-terminal domain-containing protein [Streptococcus anginosus]MED5922933.1 Rho termination factor N-terminal domain-containing protein [Streptococcus anginosus]MED5953621.1 Rho termination factor N-terminal domain-containing protein [Streptococcus anginosus]NJK10531.1 hypothe
MGAGLLRRHYAKKEVVDLSEKTLTELKAMAKEKGIEGYSTLNKEVIIEALKE